MGQASEMLSPRYNRQALKSTRPRKLGVSATTKHVGQHHLVSSQLLRMQNAQIKKRSILRFQRFKIGSVLIENQSSIFVQA